MVEKQETRNEHMQLERYCCGEAAMHNMYVSMYSLTVCLEMYVEFQCVVVEMCYRVTYVHQR